MPPGVGYPPPTNEQIMALMETDLSADEMEMQRAQGLTDALRGSAMQPSTGQHWTKQLSRGLQGVGAGLGARGEKEAMGKYRTDKKAAIGRAMGILGGGVRPVEEMLPGQYSTVNQQYGG